MIRALLVTHSARLGLWTGLLCCFATGACQEPRLNLDETSTLGSSLPPRAEPQALEVPEDYHGPIDPQWPPSRPTDLEVELSTNRLILEHLERDSWGKVRGTPLITVHTSGIHAEEGRIGGFDYIEVILGEQHNTKEALPLVVLLHGRGGRPTIPQGPYLSERPLRLFIPRGPDRLKGGYNWLATWTNSGKTELLARSLAGQVDDLMPAIEAFAALRPTLGKPIVVGFSQGGILTFALALRHHKYFSAAFPIAGWLPSSLIPKKLEEGESYPYIHALHGGADTVVPTQKGRDTAKQLLQLGIRIDFSEVPEVGHVVTPKMNELVRLWVRDQSTRMQKLQSQREASVESETSPSPATRPAPSMSRSPRP